MDFIINLSHTGSPEMDEHLKHVHNVDWSSTTLGPIPSWPRDLLQLCHVMMLAPQPRLLLLGTEQWMLYNRAYAAMVGSKYPATLGIPVREAWAESLELIEIPTRTARATGRAYHVEDSPFLVERNGFVEEVVMTWTVIPLAGLDGFYISLDDVTERRLGEIRRMIIRTLRATLRASVDVHSLWESALNCLHSHPADFPFAYLYSLNSDVSSERAMDLECSHEHDSYTLAGFVGDLKGTTLLSVVDQKEFQKSPLMCKAIRSKDALPCDLEELPFWKSTTHSLEEHRGLHKAAVICPLRSNRSMKVIGFLVTGLHDKRPYNDAYQTWIANIIRELGDAVTAVLLSEEEAKRQHRAAKQAAHEQYLLAKALADRELEIELATGRVHRMLSVMAMVDIGIVEFTKGGKLIHANESWFSLSSHPRDPTTWTESSWTTYIHEDDLKFVLSQWNLVTQGHALTFEMRWKSPPGENKSEGVWVLAACVPVTDADGRVITISCCTTDIRPQKKLQNEAVKRAEALERARLSEQEAIHVSAKFQRMQKIMEQVGVGVVEFSSIGQDAYYNLSGIPKDVDPALKSVTHHTHEEDVSLIREQWGKLLAGNSTNFEMRFKQLPQTSVADHERWVLAACMPVLDAQGKVTTVYGCLTDIAAQKRSQIEQQRRAEALERARASELRFVRFTEDAAVPIYICDHPSKRVTYCNNAWFELTGCPPTTPLAEINWVQVVHEGDVRAIDEAWDAAVNSRGSISTQFRLSRIWHDRQGRSLGHIWVLTTLTCEMREDGTVKGIMGTMNDISGLKYAESVQKLRVKEALEAKRQQEKYDCAQCLSEIRNPLSAVVHCADWITDGFSEMTDIVKSLQPSSEQDKIRKLQELIDSGLDAVNTITSCTGHQKRIVDDVLVLSKLDSNLLQLAPSSVSVPKILTDVQRMFEAEAQKVDVSLRTEMDRSIKELAVDWVFLDPGRLLQIIINLVTNAIKFTKDRETRDVTIFVGASKLKPSEDDLGVDFALARNVRDSIYDAPEFATNPIYLWFKVQDTGRGMSGTEKAKIFSRFTQASPKTYSEYGGSGLGLFISRELAGLQGGEIGVSSEENQGSTFAFFIRTCHSVAPAPAKLAMRTVNGGLKRNSSSTKILTRAGSATSSMPEDGADSQVSVLVVEDNLLNQRVLKQQLTKHGYRVHLADNGSQALDFLRTTRHWASNAAATSAQDLSVVLMDIEMPVMNGIEATKNIRDMQRKGEIRGHIPIIAVSANARVEQTKSAIAAGMDDSISKPFRIADLTPMIDRLANWTEASGH